MIKLFIQNKFTEIANTLYRLWNANTPARYVAIWIIATIPASILAYFAIMHLDPTAHNFSSFTVLMVGWAYYSIGLCVIGFIHLILFLFFGWIKSNLEIAKKGIKVTPEWKK